MVPPILLEQLDHERRNDLLREAAADRLARAATPPRRPVRGVLTRGRHTLARRLAEAVGHRGLSSVLRQATRLAR